MTSPELITKISDEPGISKAIVVLATYHNTVVSTVASGEKVAIRDFGAFQLRQTAPRTARNPRTKEIVEVPARRQMKFTPYKHISEVLNADEP